jgi:hypothetical protein
MIDNHSLIGNSQICANFGRLAIHKLIVGNFSTYFSGQSSLFQPMRAILDRGGFHKSWAQGVRHRAHPNLGENA